MVRAARSESGRTVGSFEPDGGTDTEDQVLGGLLLEALGADDVPKPPLELRPMEAWGAPFEMLGEGGRPLRIEFSMDEVLDLVAARRRS